MTGSKAHTCHPAMERCPGFVTAEGRIAAKSPPTPARRHGRTTLHVCSSRVNAFPPERPFISGTIPGFLRDRIRVNLAATPKGPAMRRLIAMMLLVAAVPPAWAQGTAPVETITSQAERARDDNMARSVVQSLLAQSQSMENQYARWKAPVCPHVYGFTPVAA